MALESLEALYIEQLKDLYSAETQIIEALPKMAKAASNADLKSAFEQHLAVTRRQKERLEQIFEELDRGPRGHKCKGMEGLIKEGEELMKKHDADPDTLDAGLIVSAQKVEHYEIAGYGSVRTFAERLGYNDAAALLQETLDEESETNEKLTMIAESHINREAVS
jgi:ferritin-like metal-binding protein YciE